MIFIQWHFCLYLFFIFLLCKTSAVYSIQCCTGNDNTCSSKPVDCPSNICFKLVINKLTEERGCLDDLIKLINAANKFNQTFNNENSYATDSLNDQCQKLGAYGNGMSLCKCTNNLCNLSSKMNSFHKLFIFIFIILIIQNLI